MIFVTVGTEKFSFDRLVKAVDEALGRGMVREPVVIQKGVTAYTPKYAEYRDFVGFEEMMDLIGSARIVISHAGVGTFLLCLQLGKLPILFPRQFKYGEHLDDHQLDFARRMDRLGAVPVAYCEEDLYNAIENYQRLRIEKGRRLLSGKDRLASLLESLV